MPRSLSICLTLLFLLTLAACGGTTQSTDNDGGDTGNGSTTDDADDDALNQAPSGFRIGTFDNDGNFNDGVISTNRESLAAGESANLRLSLVDQNDERVTEATDIFFSSDCINSGTSEVEPAVAINESGTINVTYTARGCDGVDAITARTSVEDTTLSANVTLQTERAELGSIQFDSAIPNLIGIQGAGAIEEQSVVTFLVRNSSGGPVANQNVAFTLNTAEGGIEFSPEQNTTDSNGRVTTTVTSGTVATTVRVTARANRDGRDVSAQSSALAVTTGLPDNDSFSLSATELNIEGQNVDGTTTELTVRAADRFNNPIPDNTAINFTTEGGSIESTCLTVAGACSVTLTSQDPRTNDGRVTVLATATGEESFADTTPSNGLFDDGEELADLTEAFRDDNFNGTRETNEPFRDFDNSGSFNDSNGTFEGVLCRGPNQCGSGQAIQVRDQLEIVFSGSSLLVTIQSDPIDLTGGPTDVTVEVVDSNDQPPPAGTTVAAEASQGTIVGPAMFEQASDSARGPSEFTFRLDPGDEDGDGTFSVEVITPETDTRSSDTATIDQTP